jgi:SSS family solute:Na+ symporter
LGLTALIASFMSGMAGNVTAFNTVWTNDIYEPYIKRGASDAHYLWVGRVATVVGIVMSLLAAYLVAQFNNIMDVLQLVFAFINAPLFATFLLGMFWKRANGHGAFTGLVAGSLAASVHHGLTRPAHAVVGIKGGWLAVVHVYSSEMAQNFWTAIFAWSTCFVVTIVVSLATRRPSLQDLAGLVYSETPRLPRLRDRCRRTCPIHKFTRLTRSMAPIGNTDFCRPHDRRTLGGAGGASDATLFNRRLRCN